MKVIHRNPPASLAALAAAARHQAREAVREARRAAFAAEADPLFFKVQRGEATSAEYDAKVAEIRARLPYPDEDPHG